MLTCSCGARFDVDDSLAGQEVLCPECQQSVKAPDASRLPRVTSGWALASVVLALIGAFTVVGTVVAAVLGVIALVSIARQRDHVAGTGFALFGICLGVLFTVLTVVALNAGDLFSLESWLHERTLARKLDTSGPLEIVQAIKGFAITRPTEKWGQVQDNESDDPDVGAFQENLDLLLLRMKWHSFIDVRVLPPGLFGTLDQWQKEILAEFETRHQPRNPFEDDDAFPNAVRVRQLRQQRLPPKDGMEGREIEVEVRSAGKPWQILVRLYRRGNGNVYVVRAYGPKRRFSEVRDELEIALDSFRILRR
jgi:hypothetical protein